MTRLTTKMNNELRKRKAYGSQFGLKQKKQPRSKNCAVRCDFKKDKVYFKVEGQLFLSSGATAERGCSPLDCSLRLGDVKPPLGSRPRLPHGGIEFNEV